MTTMTKQNNAGRIVLGIVCMAVPLAVGMISAVISGDQMSSFGELKQPPLSPPAWLFPAAWTILYMLMGIAILLILRTDHSYRPAAVSLFASQLILNFLWSPVFFVERDYVLAIVILALMLAVTVALTAVTWRFNKTAAKMFIPYIAWMAFASYLNVGVMVLNQ